MSIIEFKLITINDLPECYWKEHIVEIVTDPAVADVYVVMREGSANDWASYIGFPKLEDCKFECRGRQNLLYYCTSVREPSDVAESGDKLDEKTARLIFPDIKLTYRR